MEFLSLKKGIDFLIVEDEQITIYSPLIRTLLTNRGLFTEEERDRFLRPDFDRDIYDPYLIFGMDRAVARIKKAIATDEHILIYGDYDCDGIPGSVIMHDFFKKIGYKNFSNYIPHRHKEGYGLHKEAVEQFAKDGVTLLITVDLAITNIEEVALAESLGISVIVSDHHLPIVTPEGNELLPPATVVINSKQQGDTYPNPLLCGAAVAWKIVCALLASDEKRFGVPIGWEKWLLDMAGLSTIADMVPLIGENRAIAHYGLMVLRKSRRPGLRHLLREARANQNYLTEDDVGFTIGPRINAASRMDIPIEAFRLLATTDEEEAKNLAAHLTQLNDDRKGMVGSIVKDAKERVTMREEKTVIVVGDPRWNPGVLGLIAGRLVETFSRPAFVWGRGEGEVLKGSCRSDGLVNVVDLMRAVSDGTFINVGGHEFSGGFSIHPDNIHTLEEELSLAHTKIVKREFPHDDFFIDTTLTLDQVNLPLLREINKLAPFGVGNQQPAFLFEHLSLISAKHFGKEKNHLECQFLQNGKTVKAIGFFMGTHSFKGVILEEGSSIDLVGHIEENKFSRDGGVRLRIVTIAPPGTIRDSIAS